MRQLPVLLGLVPVIKHEANANSANPAIVVNKAFPVAVKQADIPAGPGVEASRVTQV